MDKTLTTLGTYLKVELLLGLISGWSRQDKIEALHATLTAVLKERVSVDPAVLRFKEEITRGK